MENSLEDVAAAIASRQERSFRNVCCYVVNYTATCDWPHKFYYNGCTATKVNGAYCSRASCGLDRKFTKAMYRLKLQCTDRSRSPPLPFPIFDQAHVLIGISAEEFAKRSPKSQQALIREKTSKGKTVDLYVKVKEDVYSGEFVGIIQMLHRVEPCRQYNEEEDKVLAEIMRTPSCSPGLGRSPGDFHTPRGEHSAMSSSGVGETSSTKGGRGSRSRSSKLSTIKIKWEDLEKSIIDLTTED